MTGDHIAAIRADARRVADLFWFYPPGAAVFVSVPLLGSLAGNAELACDEVERLAARVADLEAALRLIREMALDPVRDFAGAIAECAEKLLPKT